MPRNIEFRDVREAYHKAIETGRLSEDPESASFVGHYVYMGTRNGVDEFKHTVTHRYLRRTPARKNATPEHISPSV
jgi:hypothetical protein